MITRSPNYPVGNRDIGPIPLLSVDADKGVETNASDRVTAWRDQSGNDYDFVENGDRPLLETVNGFSALYFELGEDLILSSGLDLFRDVSERTVIAVMRRWGGSIEDRTRWIFGAGAGVSGDGYRALLGYNEWSGRLRASAKTQDSESNTHIEQLNSVSSSILPISAMYDFGNGTIYAKTDGSLFSESLTSSGKTDDSDSHTIRLGGFSNSIRGHIFKLRVYDKIFTNSELTDLAGSLMKDYE